MKKLIMILFVFVLCVALCACERKVVLGPGVNTSSSNSETTENINEPTEVESKASVVESGFATIIYNSQEISIGDVFEKVKSNFGEETKPLEIVTACGPGQTSNVYIHYYDNFEVHVDNDGKICQIHIQNPDVSLKAGVYVGQNYEEAKSLTSTEPDFEFEGYVSYKFDDCMASIQYDDTNNITTISVEANVEYEL